MENDINEQVTPLQQRTDELFEKTGEAEAVETVEEAGEQAAGELEQINEAVAEELGQIQEAFDEFAATPEPETQAPAAEPEPVPAAAPAPEAVEVLAAAAPPLDKVTKKREKTIREGFDKIAPRKVISLANVSIYHTRSQAGVHHNRRREDELVLSEVNIDVGPGEMVYLIGKVGSGKSSLLKTLYGEVPLLEGLGAIVDFDLRRLRRRDIPMLRRKIGVVFQDYQLLTDRNVFRNLHYVMSATGWKEEVKMRRRIEEVLSLVGLQNKEYKMPYELSGGEQQRLAIARALINRPQVILADEPTGNLDPAAAEGIMTLFRYIVHTGTSIVMSTHNIGNIQFYPARTLRFSAGKVEEIDIRSILGISE